MLAHGFCHLSSCTYSSGWSSYSLIGHPFEPWPGMNCAVFLKFKITEVLNIKRRKNLIGTGITQLDWAASEIICSSSMFHNSISLLCFFYHMLTRSLWLGYKLEYILVKSSLSSCLFVSCYRRSISLLYIACEQHAGNFLAVRWCTGYCGLPW